MRYYYGEGVSKDYAEAVKWLQKSADRNHSSAQYILGMCYYLGEGVPKDLGESAKWMMQAAKNDAASAQLRLGFYYAVGTGVPKDNVLAYMWTNLAASKGEKMASEAREEVAKKMTKEQIAEAQNLSREWQAQNKHTSE